MVQARTVGPWLPSLTGSKCWNEPLAVGNVANDSNFKTFNAALVLTHGHHVHQGLAWMFMSAVTGIDN